MTLTIGPFSVAGNGPGGYAYSTPVTDMGHAVVDHRGYLFAPIDGLYTFTINLEDNIVEIWLGPYAYSGWTRGNANIEAYNSEGPGLSYTAPFSAADYIPIRILGANSNGPGTFSISITAPDGTEIVGSDMASSPYLLQYSCDGSGVICPAYPAWNNES
jgi:GLEYA domain